MYSVLIQNQKTIHQFKEFYPLFLDLFAQDRIGLCRWVESGKTIDTALPGLSELVDSREKWRAIVVRVIDEAEMSKCKSVPENAYDFYANHKYVTDEKKIKRHAYGESRVPLVRLTHMLGEVPAPELVFEREVLQQEGLAPQPVFKTRRYQEDEEEYKRLQKLYEYDGNKPEEVILISFVRSEGRNDRTEIREAWTNNLEINNSDFCKTNRYSNNTRFVQYRYLNEGRTKKNADMFNFWTCVMLLSSIEIDPSSFQAFRLYDIHADINKEALSECLQHKYDELAGCRVFVENEIYSDLEKRANEKHPEPDYKMKITVTMDVPMDSSITVDADEFHLAPSSIGGEMNKWEGLRAVAVSALEDIFRKQDRVLDESAKVMRTSASMKEEEVTPLDKYEKGDMEAELSRTFDEILRTQNRLSGTRNINSEEINRISESIHEQIFSRITSHSALLVLLMMAVYSVCFFICAAVYIKAGFGNWRGVICGIGYSILIFMLGELLWLLYKKYRLLSDIDRFNEKMQENMNLLSTDVGFFSNFVSNIVSFSRGKSFLKTLRYKKFQLETEYEHLQRHLTEIDTMSERVALWAQAHYVPVSKNLSIDGTYMVDYDIGPRENKLYTFEHNKEYEIPLNNSGDTVISPFGFIERLVIKREELYEK